MQLIPGAVLRDITIPAPATTATDAATAILRHKLTERFVPDGRIADSSPMAALASAMEGDVSDVKASTFVGL